VGAPIERGGELAASCAHANKRRLICGPARRPAAIELGGELGGELARKVAARRAGEQRPARIIHT